jgi:alkaline phosphatase
VIQRGDGSLERLAYASPWSYPGGEITYGTGDHTNELVTLAVQGTPSDHALVKAEQRSWYRFGNVLDNTQIFRVLRDASGLPSVGALPTPKP